MWGPLGWATYNVATKAAHAIGRHDDLEECMDKFVKKETRHLPEALRKQREYQIRKVEGKMHRARFNQELDQAAREFDSASWAIYLVVAIGFALLCWRMSIDMQNIQ